MLNFSYFGRRQLCGDVLCECLCERSIIVRALSEERKGYPLGLFFF